LIAFDLISHCLCVDANIAILYAYQNIVTSNRNQIGYIVFSFWLCGKSAA